MSESPKYTPKGYMGNCFHVGYVDYKRRMHRHPELELNLIISGTADYVVADQHFTGRKGHMLWLFPGQQHIIYNESEDLSMWVMLFTPKFLQSWCKTEATARLRVKTPDHVHLKDLQQRVSDKLIKRAAALYDHLSDWDRFHAELHLLMLDAWQAYGDVDEAIDPEALHPSVAKAIHLLNAPECPDNVGDLAKQVGLSRQVLSEYFKRDVGIGIAEFRNRVRLEHFQQLYDRGKQYNMLEAALEAGFGSYVQFNRIFKQRYGIGPREHYRVTEVGF